MAEDGRIDEDEQPAFDGIVAELRELIQGGMELALYCTNGKENDNES